MREDKVHEDSEEHGGHGENDVGLEEQEEQEQGAWHGHGQHESTNDRADGSQRTLRVATCACKAAARGSRLYAHHLFDSATPALALALAKQRSSAASFCCHMAYRSSVFD